MTTAPDGLDTGWGSHQPALRALAKFTKIRSVIEFGAGPYSTHLFLDREAFPDLTSLVTFEHRKDWAEKVKVDDDRQALILTANANFADMSEGMEANFIFLDCAPASMRFELLPRAAVMAPVVGIHDCRTRDVEGQEYKYIKEFNSVIQTVFVSHTVDLSGIEIK